MSQTLEQTAEQLHETNKKVQLIYAFKGTGKTRLSRAFLDLVATKPAEGAGDTDALSRQKILYYNPLPKTCSIGTMICWAMATRNR